MNYIRNDMTQTEVVVSNKKLQITFKDLLMILVMTVKTD